MHVYAVTNQVRGSRGNSTSHEDEWPASRLGRNLLSRRWVSSGVGGEQYLSCLESNCAVPSLITTLTSAVRNLLWLTCTDLEDLYGWRRLGKLESPAHYRATNRQTTYRCHCSRPAGSPPGSDRTAFCSARCNEERCLKIVVL